MSNEGELFRVETEECEAFEGKSLDILKHLLNHCKSVYFFKNDDSKIELVFCDYEKKT